MKKVIVHIDDEMDITECLSHFLNCKCKEIETHGFTDPKEALDFIRKNKVDLIITDLNMPEMTGEQLLLSVYEEKIVPSIIVSGYCSNITESLVKDKNKNIKVLSKPLSMEILINEVNKAIIC